MENKEANKRVVNHEDLMKKLEALENRVNDIHDAVFLQLNVMQMYNVILQRAINDADIKKTLDTRTRTFNVLINSSNEALRSMLGTKILEWEKKEKEESFDKYSLADELLKAIFG